MKFRIGFLFAALTVLGISSAVASVAGRPGAVHERERIAVEVGTLAKPQTLSHVLVNDVQHSATVDTSPARVTFQAAAIPGNYALHTGAAGSDSALDVAARNFSARVPRHAAAEGTLSGRPFAQPGPPRELAGPFFNFRSSGLLTASGFAPEGSLALVGTHPLSEGFGPSFWSQGYSFERRDAERTLSSARKPNTVAMLFAGLGLILFVTTRRIGKD